MRWTSLLPAVAVGLGACASNVLDDDGKNEDTVTGGDAICSFPVRQHARPIPDHYLTWSGDAEREAYLASFLPYMGFRRSANTAPLADLQRAVDELYPAIVAELPAETAGMTEPPRVVLLDDPLPNAFAAGDGRESPRRAPWVLFVNEGLLALNPPPAELRGVMAHELAHLMAKHQFAEIPPRIRRHYSIGGQDERTVIPSLQADDPRIKAFVDGFESLVSYGGAFEVPVLKGFTVRFSGIEGRIRYDWYFETMGRVDTPECAAHGQKYAAFQESLRKHLSKLDHQLRIEGEAAAALAPVVEETERAARACAASAPMTLTELAVAYAAAADPARVPELEAAAARSPEELRRLVLDDDEIAIDDSGADLVTKLLELGKKKRQRLAEHVASAPVPYADMRRYAEEMEADQIAVRVLRRAGIEATGGAGFLLRTLDEPTRAQCDAILGRGEIPPFGGFAFLHPATCWRVFQVNVFAAKLEASCAPRVRR